MIDMVNKIETQSTSSAHGAAALSFDFYSAMEDARADWCALFAAAPASPYQAFEFCAAWADSIGRAQAVQPLIVVARDSAGAPLALLPLSLRRFGPLALGAFLCGRQSNFNLPLIRSGAAFGAEQMRAALERVSRAAPGGVDLFYLRNQPRRFDGADNPLVLPSAQHSASFAYGVTLPADVAALDARFSKGARKKLRKKENRLGSFGALRFEHRAEGSRALEIAQALLAQKAQRFTSLRFDAAAMRDFLEKLCAAPNSGFELHALSLDGRVIAAYAGLVHDGRFSAMINSFVQDEEIAKSSPGDLLLHALLRHLVERGVIRFDLGAGEARYKNAVCDETIELYDVVAPTTTLGRLVAPAVSAVLHAKRRIKQTPWMSDLVTRLRRA
jgi:CelD/BcsL family acetyltransferase involved in cellulose biosynthesis